MFDKILLDDNHEVNVKQDIHDEIHGLFTTIPPLIDCNVSFRNLQAGRNPDTVYRYIDGCDEYSNSNFDAPCMNFVGEKNRASVDDDLKKKLNLVHKL